MLSPPIFIRLSIADVAVMLGIPSGTINAWRNRGVIAELGVSRGENQARLYGVGDMIVLAVMRDLTAGPMAIGAAVAAEIARECLDIFIGGRSGDYDRDTLLVVQARAGFAETEVVPASELAGYLADWRDKNRQTLCTRLEFIDLRLIALRVWAKFATYGILEIEESWTEQRMIEEVEPTFDEVIDEYLKDDIENYKRSRTEDLGQVA